jgi:hypothetical protein
MMVSAILIKIPDFFAINRPFLFSKNEGELFLMSSANKQLVRPKSHPTLAIDMKLINIGYGNIISANRVIAIVSPESAPVKRTVNEARDRTQLIDATYGRRTRAVIICDSGHVILSAIQPETISNRFVVSKDHNGDN